MPPASASPAPVSTGRRRNEGEAEDSEEEWTGQGVSGRDGKADAADRASRLARFRDAGTGGYVGVEVSRMGERYLVADSGDRFIAGSQRPDGSRRKDIRVRKGYLPMEEQARFRSTIVAAREAAGMLPATLDRKGPAGVEGSNNFPPGWSPPPAPDEAAKTKAKKKKGKKQSGVAASTAHDLATVQVKKETTSKNFGGEKGQALDTVEAELCGPMDRLSVSDGGPHGSEATRLPETNKRLRSLRKKLREIEALEDSLGGRPAVNAAQQEKLDRKGQLVKEIDELENPQS